MMSNINYKYTLFDQANLTPILGKPTFETLHKLRNEIKTNAKAVYSNVGGVAHDHLGLLLTEAQSVLISPTPFVCPNHLVPLIIPDGTTAQANSDMRITHTKEVCLFREVTVAEQYIVQQVVGTVKEDYLAEIRNRMTNSINDTT